MPLLFAYGSGVSPVPKIFSLLVVKYELSFHSRHQVAQLLPMAHQLMHRERLGAEQHQLNTAHAACAGELRPCMTPQLDGSHIRCIHDIVMRRAILIHAIVQQLARNATKVRPNLHGAIAFNTFS
jgi:hypothetical protein